jgi:uncharacterized protein YndB with AHSA1/START domain
VTPRPVAIDLDGALGDTRPLWRDWLSAADVVLGVERELPEDRGEAAAELDRSGAGNWRVLLERFGEDRAAIYLRRDAAASAALRELHARGHELGVFTDAPEPLARIALAQLGADRHVRVLEAGAGALERVLDRLGDNAVVVRSRADLVALASPPVGRRLHLERTLAATPEQVFAACIEPERLAEWWGPAGFTSPRVEIDAREGGQYRITMQPPAGEAFHLSGEFREIERPRRLAYTFVWDPPDPDDRETVVTLTFDPVGDETRLVLDQGPFETDARYALHEDGWTETLDRLAEALARTG